LFFIPAGIGVAIFVIIFINQKKPEKKPPQEVTATARIIELKEQTILPMVTGYGEVEPGKSWKAMAEVSGKIVKMDPLLEQGQFVNKDQELVFIDKTDYKINVDKATAEVKSLKAQIAELEVSKKNYEANLKIQKHALVFLEKELKRDRGLRKKDAISVSEADKTEKDYLNQTNNIQNTQNSLNVIPSQRDELLAKLDKTKADLEQAEQDLKDTVIKAPFDCRVGPVKIEQTQFVQKGQELFSVDGISKAEISCQVPYVKLRNLMNPNLKPHDLMKKNPQDIPKQLGISAKVILPLAGTFSHGQYPEWPGQCTRIDDQIDVSTRTVGVVVQVDNPYQNSIPGIRPALVKGMYCRAELFGHPRTGAIIIPRSAIHNDYVYLVNKEGRLKRQKVQVAFLQENFAVIKSGLNSGEQIIISDIQPAIDGMLIKSETDDKMMATISNLSERKTLK